MPGTLENDNCQFGRFIVVEAKWPENDFFGTYFCFFFQNHFGGLGGGHCKLKHFALILYCNCVQNIDNICGIT